MKESVTTGIFAVFDKLAEQTGPTFEARNEGVAIRAFRNLMKENNLPESEFRLLKVGEIEREPIIIKGYATPEEISQDWSVYQKKEETNG